jgi:phosphoribosylformylglycinamidine cyclo-ligase
MENLYQKAGVNLFEAQKLNEKLNKTHQLNAFAGITNSPLLDGYSIVTCCDGIGSKIIPLYERNLFKTIATDVVAANLNDLVCSGATAAGFVDYIAVNKLDSDKISQIVEGIEAELSECNCKLLGGETSEISELITENNIDISGFAVGVVKNGEELDKKNVAENDIVIGLCSSGIHANGFSLIRKLYKENQLTAEEFELCLAPTHIYYNCVLELAKLKLIKSCANITGGGIFSNLIRSIPENMTAELGFEKIPESKKFGPIFKKLKTICGEEFYEVFNAGVGFCLISDETNKEKVFEICAEFSPFILGKITEKDNIC